MSHGFRHGAAKKNRDSKKNLWSFVCRQNFFAQFLRIFSEFQKLDSKSEPVEAKQGKFQGTIVMQDEQDKGLNLIQMLSDDQRSEAILMNRKDGNNNLTEAYKDNVVLDYAGIVGSKLDRDQKEALLSLIEEYVGNMRKGHANVRMSQVKQHLDD